jgi:hypothetical protein
MADRYTREELAVLLRRCGLGQTLAHLSAHQEGEEFMRDLGTVLGVTDVLAALGSADTSFLLRASEEALKLAKRGE